MDSPFFSNYWNQPSQPRYSPSANSGVPVNQPSQSRYSPASYGRGVPVNRKTATTASTPKVVSIPVHFVGSENKRSDSDSALTIQKVFRGFLVRKSVKRIVSIRREVEEIEKKLEVKETIELIRRDSKERLRINETLMASLFKLDSVRGISSGVRDFRKAVIRKAIALQEKVDALVSSNDSDLVAEEAEENHDMTDSFQERRETTDAGVEESRKMADTALEQSGEITDSVMKSVDDADYANSRGWEFVDPDTKPSNESPAENCDDCKINSEQATLPEDDPIKMIANSVDEAEIVQDDETPDCLVKDIVVDFKAKDLNDCEGESVENCFENLEGDAMELQKTEEVEGEEMDEEEDRDNNNSGELKAVKEEIGVMKRMREDNEKMMELMNELISKNEMQTRMLNSLTQRVANLEKAFLCDKLRRRSKKKRQQPTADGKQQP